MAKKRASQAPILVAYVLTMLICLVIFGSAAVVMLDVFVTQLNEQREREEQLAQNQQIPEEDLTAADYSSTRKTFLFVGAQGETLNGIALIRILPDTSSVRIVPIPNETVAVVGSSTETIATHFENGGMTYLQNAVEGTYGITCDRYIKISNDGFNRLVEYFGGTTSYVFPEDLYYKDEVTGETTSFTQGQATRTLWGDDIRRIVTYPLYAEKETPSRVIGEIGSSLINNGLYTYKDNIQNNLQNIFNTLFNNSDTDITSRGFKEDREAYEYLVENAGLTSCTYRLPDGNWDTRGNFNVSEDCKEQIETYFELTPAQ